MKNKFNIGDRVSYTVIGGQLRDEFAVFTICLISVRLGEICYSDDRLLYIEEFRLSLYVEPKPKVKKYLWVYQYVKQPHSLLRQSISCNFYADESEFKNDYQAGELAFIKRLDWSETEFEVEGE